MSKPSFPMELRARRRALALGHVNGALWSIGNGLTTGPLVLYLAQDLGAQGLALGLVLATPNAAGVLRLLAPAIIHRAGTAKRACLSLSLASYALIFTLPAVALVAPSIGRRAALTTMITLVFVHQLLEYIATVALWSWWADLVPQSVRGRYFARRQIIQLAALVPTLLAGGYFADAWRARYADDPDRLLVAYAVPTAVGAAALVASIVPLALMPSTRRYQPTGSRIEWPLLRAALTDRRFARLLIFRCLFSLANGVSQTVQAVYPKRILQFGVGDMAAMRTVMQFGQMGAARWVGRWSDRFGNRPVLMAAQACVTASLLFFIVAGDGPSRWLLVGAWVLFSAYVAHNICLPNLTLKLAPAADASAYVATSDALASLCHAAATVAGGMTYDWLRTTSSDPSHEPYRSCLILFAAGMAMRGFGVVLLAAIREPGAWTWREIVAGHVAVSDFQSPVATR
jgi:MFS family permease